MYDGTKMKSKSYKITFCLQAGYSGMGKEYSAEDAKELVEKWMIQRLEADQPVVNGVLSFGTLFFPAKGRREDGKTVTVADTGVYVGNIFYDETSSRENDEVKDTLNSLSLFLKEGLGQERVYVVYEDESWYL